MSMSNATTKVTCTGTIDSETQACLIDQLETELKSDPRVARVERSMHPRTENLQRGFLVFFKKTGKIRYQFSEDYSNRGIYVTTLTDCSIVEIGLKAYKSIW